MKRLTTEERMVIQGCLIKKMSLEEIARRLKRNKSTISREISTHIKITNGCKEIKCTHHREYLVCNNCPSRNFGCNYSKRFYDFNKADEAALRLRSESRRRSKLTNDQIDRIDEILTLEIRGLRQSLHHVYVANPELSKMCSERTIRRMIYRRELTVKAHELRRYVRYSHKEKDRPKTYLKDLSIIVGRTYTDFLDYTNKHRRLNVVQYDSVIGKIDDKKAILTITFKKYAFQFGVLIKKGDSHDVVSKIRKLFRKLGNEVVKEIFPINIADNGTEFSCFNEIENDCNGEKICRTYFTTPYRSNDKSECERNHQYVRYFLPKGKSLNFLTQEIVDYMFSQINSCVRESKCDQTPYDIILRKYGKSFLEAINIQKVEKKRVNLNPLV